MVTKSSAGTKKKGKTKVGKLKLNRETVKNLSSKEQEKVKGGIIPRIPTITCGTVCRKCDDGKLI
jgi:hypothetical protein